MEDFVCDVMLQRKKRNTSSGLLSGLVEQLNREQICDDEEYVPSVLQAKNGVNSL